MASSYLLDTNTVIAAIGMEIDLERRRRGGDEIYLSVPSLGELFFGAEKSQRVQDNISQIQRLIATFPVVSCDQDTARHYGFLRNLLKKKGRPIPVNDLWIAASARQHGLTLVTRDGHFDYVEGLALEKW